MKNLFLEFIISLFAPVWLIFHEITHMVALIDRVSLLPVQVMTQIAENGINLYALPDCDEDEDEDYREQCRLLKVSLAAKVV